MHLYTLPSSLQFCTAVLYINCTWLVCVTLGMQRQLPHPPTPTFFSLPFPPPAGLQAAEAAFADAGQDLTAVVEACISSTHANILHRGAGACPPAEKTEGATLRVSSALGRHGGQGPTAPISMQ